MDELGNGALNYPVTWVGGGGVQCGGGGGVGEWVRAWVGLDGAMVILVVFFTIYEQLSDTPGLLNDQQVSGISLLPLLSWKSM